MDNRAQERATLQELFSRGATPPTQQPQHQQFSSGSHLSNSSSPNQIDSLFHHLSTPGDQQLTQQSASQTSDNYGNSAPVTPAMPLTDEPSTVSNASAPSVTAADRQSALLSLLGGPATGTAARGNANNINNTVPLVPAPAQVPTPPGSSQRSEASPSHNTSHNEAQGKILLEQLMAG